MHRTMMDRFPFLAFLLALSALALAGPACAAVYTVTKDGDGQDEKIQPILTPQGTFTTLSDLVFRGLADGDTVHLGKGKYVLGDTLTLSHGATLIGAGPDQTILDGGDAHQIIYAVTSSSARIHIEGLTITRGKDAHQSGGMHVGGAGEVRVANCAFTGNESGGEGGGIYHVDGSLTVTDCAFADNTAKGAGGGIYTEARSATVTNCAFTRNTAAGRSGGGAYGGGAYLAGSATVTNCTFAGNAVTSDTGAGGGAYLAGSATVANCTFTGNAANEGGGACFNDSATLTNCTFVNDSSSNGQASEILNAGGTDLSLVNTLLWGAEPSKMSFGNVSLKNCAVPDGFGSISGAVTKNDCVTVRSWPSPAPFTATVEGVEHTVYRIADDAALDVLKGVGSSAGAPATDQLGQRRGVFPCIGAVEHIAATDITLDETTLSLRPGERATLTATLAPAGAAGAIAWTSSDPAVAFVSDGTVVGLKEGMAVITATLDGQRAFCVVTVGDGSGALHKVTAADDGHGTALASPSSAASGDVVTILASPNSGYKFKEWTSGDGVTFADATSASTTFMMPGKAVTVTATFELDGGGGTPTYSVRVDVTNGRALASPKDAPQGATVDLLASPSSGYKFKEWTSGDGVTFADATSASTTFTMPGKAVTVTAIFELDSGGGGSTVTSVTLDEATLSIEPGETGKLTATLSPAGATAMIAWASTHPDVATVSADGTVTGRKAGTAIITATAGGQMAFCVVTVGGEGTPGGGSGGGCSNVGLGGLAMMACAALIARKRS